MEHNYDSVAGIIEGVSSLEALNELLRERQIAGYKRNERLNEWIILGRYYLDSCGNSMKYIGKDIPCDTYPGLPPVILHENFKELLVKLEGTEFCTSFMASMSDDIPLAHLNCPECGKRWTIENCHDTVVSHESRVVSLKDYAGQKLSAPKKDWDQTPNAIWRLQPEKSIRNDIYINYAIEDTELGRKYQWPVNERGWIQVDDSYIIHSGDEALVNIWTYRHRNCHRMYLAKVEREYFENILNATGFKAIQMTEIPNQYCPCDHCAPWYEVIADGIHLTIGWRKRVINIGSDDKRINFKKLFAGEDVTKEQHYIHAWGKEKCIEYLQRIKEHCTLSLPRSH